jgi:peptide/nickel transport system substrate-binding protein
MRGKRLLVLAALPVLIASACRRESRVGPPPEQPIRGGTLVAAINAGPDHLNPGITTFRRTLQPAALIYNALLALDEDLRPQPELAESFRVEQDGARYRFTLREGVKWHDGKPFTSADVKFTFEEVLLKAHPRTSVSLRGKLVAIETPDQRTVVFNLREPYAPFLSQLGFTDAPILAKHIYEGTDPFTNPANQKPVGTGPFKFVSYVAGAEVRLSRNGDYFREGLPYLDEVVIRIVPDLATQALALEKGELDYLFSAIGPDLPALKSNPDLVVTRTNQGSQGTNCVAHTGLNLDRPLLRDVRVRRALQYALDGKAYLDQVQFGEGRVADAPFSSGIEWAHTPDLDFAEFDRDESERLLQAAGWRIQAEGPRVAQGVAGVPDGTKLSLEVVPVSAPSFVFYGDLLKLQLRAVGVDTVIRQLDAAAVIQTVFKDRSFDLHIAGGCHGPDPEIGARRFYHSSGIGPVSNTNSAGYSNPQVDSLFDQAARETDLQDRGRLYREIQEVLVKDQPYLWMFELPEVAAHTESCSGFKAHAPLFAETAYCKR